MSVIFYHVNAFTAQPFTGNPAAVVILQSDEQFNDDNLLQKIATEFNLPATVFLLPSIQAVKNAVLKQKIKWFDRSKRIPICGHGTLAASHILFEGNTQANTIEYDAGPAGALAARRDKEDSVVLDFPACRLVGIQDVGQAIKEGVDLERVLKSLFPDDVKIKFVGRGDRGGYVDLLVVEVMENYPLKEKKLNNRVLEALLPEVRGIIVTTRSSKDSSSHIHSRVFNTDYALGEEHATGSAHCMLSPYWSEKLHLADAELKATQVSQRGGVMNLVWREGDMRVLIRSSAVTLATGVMNMKGGYGQISPRL